MAVKKGKPRRGVMFIAYALLYPTKPRPGRHVTPPLTGLRFNETAGAINLPPLRGTLPTAIRPLPTSPHA